MALDADGRILQLIAESALSELSDIFCVEKLRPSSASSKKKREPLKRSTIRPVTAVNWSGLKDLVRRLRAADR